MRALLLISVLLGACTQVQDRAIERRIRSLVKTDGTYLANLEATYGVAFTSATDGFFSDKLYVRRDVARVYYGYSLDAAQIRVARRDGTGVLVVVLPPAGRIATDRHIVTMESSHRSYKPKIDGKVVDIEEVMNAELDATVDRYHERTMEMTRTMTREYFATLAQRFGLDLDLAFATAANGV